MKRSKFSREYCYKLAQDCKTRSEMKRMSDRAYRVALKNGWITDYTWFVDGHKTFGESITKWNRETCLELALKCNTRAELKKRNQSAYDAALRNGWIADYTWFVDGHKYQAIKRTKWTRNKCAEEAEKYSTITEFAKKSSGAYDAAWRNGWLTDYTWFVSTQKPNGYWTKETCFKAAQECSTKSEFKKKHCSAYTVALKNGWLDDYTWFIRKPNVFKDKVDTVYAYFFPELNSVYIGRTVNRDGRHYQHKTIDNDTVFLFAQKNNRSVPEMTIIESNLTLSEGLDKEDYYVKKYLDEGWNVLNRAKTGGGCGSIGSIGSGKWNYKSCADEAKKYNSSTEFQKQCGGAFNAARRNGWLKEYTWFWADRKPWGYWNCETCYELASQCNSIGEFKKKSNTAYNISRKNGWLQDYTWFISPLKPRGYWNHKTCRAEAMKYYSRSEFRKGNGSAYNIAWKNGWLQDYTWFNSKIS